MHKGPKPSSKQPFTPLLGIPDPPTWLDSVGRKHFREIVSDLNEAGILSTLDAHALAFYCDLYSQWREARDKVKEQGAVIEAINKYQQPNPWQKIRMELLKEMRTYLDAFGLSPRARTKLDLGDDESGADDGQWAGF